MQPEIGPYWLNQLQNLVAPVGRIADQLARLRVGNEIEHLQRSLPNEHRKVVRDFHRVQSHGTSHDRQDHGVVQGNLYQSPGTPSPLLARLGQSELLDETRW